MLVKFPRQPTTPDRKQVSDKEKLQIIKSEINSAIEDRIEELRQEAEKLHGTMEQIQWRIKTQGFEVKLDDLKTGKWYKVGTEIKVLQEVASFIIDLETP